MPQIHRVITLSEDERAILNEAVSSEKVKRITNDLAKGLKGATEVNRSTKVNQLTSDLVTSALAEIEQKEQALTALPQIQSRDEHLDDVRRAIALLREAQAVLQDPHDN